MADYDLGTAHGRVVIDYDDKGSKAAQKDLQTLQARAAGLMGPLKNLGNQVRSFGMDFEENSAKLSKNAQLLAGAGTVLASMSGLFKNVAGSAGLLSGGIGIFKALSVSVAGVPEGMKNFPNVIQNIVRLAASITLLKAGAGAITGLVSRLGLVGKLGGVFTGLTAGIGALLSHIPGIGLLGGIFGGLGARITGLIGSSAIIARLTAGMGALGMTGGSLIGLITSIAKTAFGVMSLMKAFTAFASIAKFAAIGIAAVGLASVLLSGAMSVLGSVVGGTTTFVRGLFDAVGQLTGIAAILPGVLATAGLVMLTLKVGMAGFGKALKTVGGDQDKFNKAIADFGPNAKSTLVAIRELALANKDLKTSVQDKIFDGLAASITALGTAALPTVKDGMGSVATSINGVIKQFLGFFAQSNRIVDVGLLFSSTARTVDNFKAAIQPLLSIFTDFAVVGARAFADLTGGAGKFTTGLAATVTEARNSGLIYGWIVNAVQGFKDLFAGIWNIKEAFSVLFSGIGSSGDEALARFRNFTAGLVILAGNTDGLVGKFKTFKQIIETIAIPWLDVLKTVFSTIMSSLEPLLPVLVNLVAVVGKDVNTAFTVIAPLLTAFATGLAAILGPLTPFIGVLAAAAVIVAGFAAAFAVFGPIVSLFLGLYGVISGGIGIFTALSGIIAGVTGSTGLLAVALGILTSPFLLIPLAIAAVVAALIFCYVKFDWFRNAVNAAVAAVWAFIQPILMMIAAFFITKWGEILAFIQSVMPQIQEAIGHIWVAIQAIIQVAMTIIMAIITIALSLILGFWNAWGSSIMTVITAIWTVIQTIISTALTVIMEVIRLVLAVINGDWDLALNALLAIVSAVWNLITTVIGAALNIIVAVIVGVLNSIQAVFSLIWNAILDIVTTVFAAISSAVSSALQYVQGVFSAALAWISGFIQGQVDMWRSAFASVMSAIAGLVSSGIEMVKSYINGLASIAGTISGFFSSAVSAVSGKIGEMVGLVGGLPGRILGALGNLGGLLYNAGSSIIDGLISGVRSGIESLMSVFSGITSMIPDFKGPAVVDAKLLTPNGKLIMDGLIRGIKSQTPELQKMLSGLTADIPGMSVGSIPSQSHASTARTYTDTSAPATMAAPTQPNIEITVHNPIEEKTSVTILKSLDRIAMVS